MFRPSSVRAFAIVRSISKPFNGKRTVEAKLSSEDVAISDVDVYLRMSPERAEHYAVGDVFVLRLDKV